MQLEAPEKCTFSADTQTSFVHVLMWLLDIPALK